MSKEPMLSSTIQNKMAFTSCCLSSFGGPNYECQECRQHSFCNCMFSTFMPDKGGPLAIFMYYWLDWDIFIIVSHLSHWNCNWTSHLLSE